MERLNNLDAVPNTSSAVENGATDLYIIKVGGNVIDDDIILQAFLSAFASVEGKKILVHGGGKLATKLSKQLGIEQRLIDGRRITDGETLKIVTMVYAGYINKNIVAQLHSNGAAAIGLSGADGNLIQSHKRTHPTTDYGFVGDVDAVNTALLKNLLDQNLTIVVAPITHNMKGQLLNTNADTVAQEIAQAMSASYKVHLVYCFEKTGVLMNADDDSTVIAAITPSSYEALKQQNIIFAGMIPKLDNAFAALKKGVYRVVVGKAENLPELIIQQSGTSIIHE